MAARALAIVLGEAEAAADPLVNRLPADAGRARRDHGPARRADAVTGQLLVRVETRPSIDHQGAPLGDVISTTTSTDGAPPSVNNVSGRDN